MNTTEPHTKPAPHDPDAERALLGSMMLDTGARRAALERLERVGTDAFYLPAHRHVYTAIAHCAEQGLAPDPLIIADQLATTTNGSGPTRTDLLNIYAQGSSTAAEGFLRIVVRDAYRRKILTHAAELTDRARSGDDTDKPLADLIDLHTTLERPAQIEPQDLTDLIEGNPPTIIPTIWARTDGPALIYPGKITTIQAEPSVGKSWMALAVCAEQILAGHTTLYLDLEADAATHIERLRALDVPDDTIRDRFLYLRPDQPFGPSDRLALVGLVRTHHVTVVVIDTLAAILALHALNENDAPDVLAFLVPVARPLAREGAAVLILDHVVKDKDTRGRWARGSGGKLGEMDAAYTAETIQAYSRTRSGSVRLKVAKDRYGALPALEKDVATDITITVTDSGRRVQIDPGPPGHNTPDSEPWIGPTHCMEAITELLTTDPTLELSANQIGVRLKERGHGFRRTIILSAVRMLTEAGTVLSRSGPRASILYRAATPTEPDPLDTLGDEF